MKNYDGANCIVDDLRDDFRSDNNVNGIPASTYKTPRNLHTRLMYLGACDDALHALEEAATEFGHPLNLDD